MRGKVLFGCLLSHMKAKQLVLDLFEMSWYVPDKLHVNIIRYAFPLVVAIKVH